FQPFRVHQLERLEVAEAVGAPVGKAVDQHVDAPEVEIVPEPRAPDRQLALVGGAEARPDQHARHVLEHILKIRGTRLVDGLLAHELGAAGHAIDGLARLFLGARAVRWEWTRLDDDRLELRRGRRRSLAAATAT